MSSRGPAGKDGVRTETVAEMGELLPLRVRVVVLDGPDQGREAVLARGSYTVGKSSACHLELSDHAVSRRHLEVLVEDLRIVCRDLGSTNGSFFGGARFSELQVPLGARFVLGKTTLAVLPPEDRPAADSGKDTLARLAGRSPVMREVLVLAEQAAASDEPVLITGETGTGKEVWARAIHGASARRKGPFIVCDLAGLSRNVLESELFGHVRGAFTGADRDSVGAFLAAAGGTVLVDEIGELEPDLQPRLLRAIERREVKPVGSSAYRRADVRVVAATQRDLESEVGAGRFRRDLYHRLAVLRLALPPLRARPADILRLVAAFVEEQRPGRPLHVPPETLALLGEYEWPGNARELRNVVARALAANPDAERLSPRVLGLPSRAAVPEPGTGADASFRESKERLVNAWEREYLADLLQRAGGNVTEAARRGGLDRAHLYRLLRKHGLLG